MFVAERELFATGQGLFAAERELFATGQELFATERFPAAWTKRLSVNFK